MSIMYVDQQTLDRCNAKIRETENELMALLKNKEEAASHHQRGADWQETPIPSQIAMQEAMARRKLEELKKARATMKVTDSMASEVVRIGSTVTIRLQEEDEDDEEMCILLVFTAPKERKEGGPIEISKGTELGRAILGKKVNDTVTYIGNDDNAVTVTILKIQ